jgi:ring-1,2-phenylacetyl-CoA epoxidase subunit PaaB
MDTQWPRFEVFEQERPDLPHRNAGSVHAPDAELALQNARDVFARRPSTVSLWVAPAEAIYSRTAEELEASQQELATAEANTDPGLAPKPYLIFHKLSQRQAETFVSYAGQVEARGPAEALAMAQQRFSSEPVFVWWVIPASAVIRSEAADAESMFAPALAKPHRMPNYYQVHRQMRAVKAGEGPADETPGSSGEART